MATYCRHPYIQLRARSSVSLRSGGSILLSKAGPFLASGEGKTAQTIPDWVAKVFGKELHPAEQHEKSGRGR